MTQTWKKVKAPRTWYPSEGESLTGRYCGRTKRNGTYGQYEVVMVLDDQGRVFKISGTMIIQLIDVSLIKMGDEIRIVYTGKKEFDSIDGESGKVRYMKEFELYVREEHVVLEEPKSMEELLK